MSHRTASHQQNGPRNNVRLKGSVMGRNQNRSAVSTDKNAGVRVNYEVEDEFEQDMNSFIEKLMNGASSPLNIEDDKKLSQDYEEAVTNYTKNSVTSGSNLSKEDRKRVGYNFNFEILTSDRRNTSQNMRQAALDRIVEALASKYDPSLFQLNDLDLLAKAFISGRTNQEMTQALRSIAMISALEIDDSAELLTEQIIPHAWEIIKGGDYDATFRASTIASYALIQSFISSGSQGYGLDDRITDLLDIVNESFNKSSDAIICASAISGMSLLLMHVSSPNHIIEQILPEVLEFLKSDNVDIVNAAGKLIALSYELYDFAEQLEETATEHNSFNGSGNYRLQIPTVENEDLIEPIEDLASPSTSQQRISKDGKSERRSTFRTILSFLEVRLQVTEPANALTEEGRESSFEDSIAQIRLSRSKTFAVDTWSQLVLYQGLKWLYNYSLAIHLAENPLIKELSKEAGSVKMNSFSYTAREFHEEEAAVSAFDQPKHSQTGDNYKRSKEIQKQRDEKARALGQGF